jgi:hypothetical protein
LTGVGLPRGDGEHLLAAGDVAGAARDDAILVEAPAERGRVRARRGEEGAQELGPGLRVGGGWAREVVRHQQRRADEADDARDVLVVEPRDPEREAEHREVVVLRRRARAARGEGAAGAMDGGARVVAETARAPRREPRSRDGRGRGAHRE